MENRKYSVIDVVTKIRIPAEIRCLSTEEIGALKEWELPWRLSISQKYEVYGLVVPGDTSYQGLIAFNSITGGALDVALLESKRPMKYKYVGCSLMAFAVQKSLDLKLGGNLIWIFKEESEGFFVKLGVTKVGRKMRLNNPIKLLEAFTWQGG